MIFAIALNLSIIEHISIFLSQCLSAGRVRFDAYAQSLATLPSPGNLCDSASYSLPNYTKIRQDEPYRQQPPYNRILWAMHSIKPKQKK